MKIFIFWVFNSLLPGSDVGSDLFTFFDLYRNKHYKWAAVTLLLTFNPFLIHTSMFCFDFLSLAESHLTQMPKLRSCWSMFLFSFLS